MCARCQGILLCRLLIDASANEHGRLRGVEEPAIKAEGALRRTVGGQHGSVAWLCKVPKPNPRMFWQRVPTWLASHAGSEAQNAVCRAEVVPEFLYRGEVIVRLPNQSFRCRFEGLGHLARGLTIITTFRKDYSTEAQRIPESFHHRIPEDGHRRTDQWVYTHDKEAEVSRICSHWRRLHTADSASLVLPAVLTAQNHTINDHDNLVRHRRRHNSL
jgi:hypothetical protein